MSDPVAAERPVARTHVDGDQIVRCGLYAYRWRGAEPLKVGDRVLLPPSWASPHGWTATVTALGTDYFGTLASVVRRVD